MQTETIPLDETDCFSSAFIDYVAGKKSLTPFYNSFPKPENFQSLIDHRNFPRENRNILTRVLQKQYQDIAVSKAVSNNIEALQEDKTFTITTGHQLNIFTGPLYFIYKIVTVINACKELKKAYPNHHFVPVYWMASEDHDFEEISYFHLNGKKTAWETDQTGAVGRMDPAALKDIAKTLPNGASFFEEAYGESTLANAVRAYVNHLFQDEGLVVVDADDAELKSTFIPVMEADIFHNVPQNLVNETSSKLESVGVKPQVYPREINFFYLEEAVRERLEKVDDGYHVLNQDTRFTKDQIAELIQSSPEKFSPNVILRPLYQETILPNLAYVGGPSELVYWLQLKAVFDHFEVPFPALMPRNFAVIQSATDQKKWSNAGLTTQQLFGDMEDVFSSWVKENNHQLTFQQELDQLAELEAMMKKTTSKIDPTLSQHIEAIAKNFQGKVAKAEKKLLRAEKRKHQEKRDQIASVKESLFPGGTLQERKVNFLNFYLKDSEFIQNLKEHFDPFNFQMYVFTDQLP